MDDTPRSAKQMDILIIEDTATDAAFLCEALQSWVDAHLAVVLNGEAALDIIFGTGVYAAQPRTLTPALIFLDFAITQVPAQEVLKILKAYSRTRSIPVVVLVDSATGLFGA
jgi:CheY-like chemotaxis protein